MIKMDAVAPHRKRTEASLLDKVVEEARDSVGERMKLAPPSGRLVPGQDNREHVLHGARTSLAIERVEPVCSS